MLSGILTSWYLCNSDVQYKKAVLLLGVKMCSCRSVCKKLEEV